MTIVDVILAIAIAVLYLLHFKKNKKVKRHSDILKNSEP